LQQALRSLTGAGVLQVNSLESDSKTDYLSIVELSGPPNEVLERIVRFRELIVQYNDAVRNGDLEVADNVLVDLDEIYGEVQDDVQAILGTRVFIQTDRAWHIFDCALQRFNGSNQASLTQAHGWAFQALSRVIGKLKSLKREGKEDRMGQERSKPRIFVGSSKEGLEIARAIQLELEHDAEVVIWSQGVFGLSRGTLESLVEEAGAFDFAILVLTPDDMTTKRGKTANAPRDNVLLELGLFIGRLGRERTYAMYCRDDEIDLPSDLAGVTPADFARPSAPKYLQASVGSACSKIRRSIADLGVREGIRSSP
jgi:predicted nucleotide-binding protein